MLRLNKAISSTGFCSRRKADELIFSGRVTVNGILAKNPGSRVSTSDVIAVDTNILARQVHHKYLVMNKPIHTLCTLHDPQGRKTVIDILPAKYQDMGIFPVGRLDYFSEGLLLLTNDGDFAQKMMHPRFRQHKVYEITIRENIPEKSLRAMNDGMFLENGVKTLPAKVDVLRHGTGGTILRMELSQGLNRQIRKMCAVLNLTILRLRRISQGNVELGGLKPGEVRELAGPEFESLIRDIA